MKSLEDEPVLQRHLFWVWKAFTDLNFRRGVSFGGALPITYTDIHAFCLLKGIYSIFERERLCYFIDALDRHWMTNHYEKQEQKQKQASAPTPKTPAPRKPGPRKPPRQPVS